MYGKDLGKQLLSLLRNIGFCDIDELVHTHHGSQTGVNMPGYWQCNNYF